jgi:GTP-binding protein
VRTTFIISAARSAQLPALDLPEVAFLGRSNVGKSSLLNALVHARIARTSSTPGRTQQINLFRVHAGFGDFALADLPGYGYAKAPEHLRASWGPLVENYLDHRLSLRAALLLLDARRDVSAEDREVYEALRGRLHARGALAPVVLTKVDKLPKAKRKPQVAAVARTLEVPREAVVATSAAGRLGLEVLLRRLSVWVGGPEPASSD